MLSLCELDLTSRYATHQVSDQTQSINLERLSCAVLDGSSICLLETEAKYQAVFKMRVLISQID